MNKNITENTSCIRLVDQVTPKDEEIAIGKDESYFSEEEEPKNLANLANEAAVVSWEQKCDDAPIEAKETLSKQHVQESTINSIPVLVDSQLVDIKSNLADKTVLNSSIICLTHTDAPAPPSLRRGSQIPPPLSSIPGAHRIGRQNSVSSAGSLFDESTLNVVSAHLVTDEEEGGNDRPHSTRHVLVEAKPLDKLPILLMKNRNFQLGFGLAIFIVCVIVPGLVIGFSGGAKRSNNNSRAVMVDDFMQILPTILSDKSLAQLETNGSPQALAVEWIHSIPYHAILSMERLIQRFALAVFYYSTSGASWINNDDWLSDSHECLWFNANDMPCRAGILTALELRDNGLFGTIPDEVGLLTNLSILDLAECGLGSTIPTTLGQLTLLENLFLFSNFLTGTIPQDIWKLTNMRYIVINENGLEGSLSTDIGALTQLEEVNLSDNSLTGSIPTEIGNWRNLMTLEISGVDFTGIVPTEIGALSELREIIMEGVTLTGTVPAEIGRLTHLVLLFLDENSLYGTLPTELLTMTNLEHLGLGENHLSGPLDSLVTLTNLQTLRLGGNSFSGTIPLAFEQFTNVSLLELRDNQLSGSIPSRLCTLREERLSSNEASSDEDPDFDLISVDCGRVKCDCCVGLDLAPCP